MQPTTGGPGAVTGVVLSSLADVAAAHGLDALAARLAEVQALAADDLVACAEELETVQGESLVQRSARHLLALGGKRLRPLCVALCARLGSPRDAAVRDFSVAVELVHSATLLHDDVVDGGDTRRGQPTARTVYGNAASIFAGDWLLVDALRRVNAHGLPGVFDALLASIDEMIAGESLQLENRGKATLDRDTYFRVARGKTAALFRWACGAGACAGGLDEADQAALASFGEEVGLAFQLVDDVLDVAGDPARTGKTPFADLAEGKVTYPLILLLEREPEARPLLSPFVRDEPPAARDVSALFEALERTNAVQATRERAEEHVRTALERLDRFPPSDVREALRTVALAAVQRDR